MTDDLIYQSVKKGTALNEAIDQTFKGKEMKMPEGLYFTDKDGTRRTEIRIKWWENPSEMTYKTISVEPIENLPVYKNNSSLCKHCLTLLLKILYYFNHPFVLPCDD